ncbi:MAG: antibiotic biosynthesis monooxygenase [Candidatus Sulfotelmatobacter sp.]|jgi:quinol monooxygenase YgiN
MFIRTLECDAKVGKREELADKVTRDVLPILRNQRGFANMIALSDDAHPKHLVYLTFWKSKEEAQQYQRERYEQIVNLIKHLIVGPPTVESFTVEVPTNHEIVASKAAA